MSINFKVTGTFDGTTVFDLGNPNTIDPQTQVREYTPIAPVGIMSLPSSPQGFTAIWCQVISTKPDPGNLIEVLLLLQDGREEIVIPETDENAAWNVLMPQASSLKIRGDNGQGGDPSGSVYFSTWSAASTSWPHLQCCHFFAPQNA